MPSRTNFYPNLSQAASPVAVETTWTPGIKESFHTALLNKKDVAQVGILSNNDSGKFENAQQQKAVMLLKWNGNTFLFATNLQISRRQYNFSRAKKKQHLSPPIVQGSGYSFLNGACAASNGSLQLITVHLRQRLSNKAYKNGNTTSLSTATAHVLLCCYRCSTQWSHDTLKRSKHHLPTTLLRFLSPAHQSHYWQACCGVPGYLPGEPVD